MLNINYAGLARCMSGAGIGLLIFDINWHNPVVAIGFVLILISNTMFVVMSPTHIDRLTDLDKIEH